MIAYSPPGTTYDDFALNERGDAFLVTEQGNTSEKVGKGGEPQVIVAGNFNSTENAEPTAEQSGRMRADGEVLYLTTGGGSTAAIDADEIVGGQLAAVHLRG